MSSRHLLPFLVSALLYAAPAAAQSEQGENITQTPSSGFDGHFFIQSEDGKNRLQFDGLLQARYELISAQGQPATDQAEAVPEIHDGFFILPRARLGIRGTVFSKKLAYRVLLDVGRGKARMLDYYIDYKFFPELHLRIGQDRKPFSRSFLTPAWKLQFVDRARTESNFAAGRGIGALVHNGYLKAQGFEYAAGIYNQTGINAVFDGREYLTDPGDIRTSAVLHVGHNFGPTDGYTGSDLRKDGKPALAIAASANIDLDTDSQNDGKLQGDVNYAVKAYGFSSSGAFYASTQQNGESYFDRAALEYGAYTQMGYVIKRRVEPAVRVSWDKHQEGDPGNLGVTAGINVFFFGQNFKWQTDGTLYDDLTNSQVSGYQFRTQLQLAY